MGGRLTVVTGAGGFIGGHLVAALLRQGGRPVRAVDRKPASEWYQRFEEAENLELDLTLREHCEKALDSRLWSRGRSQRRQNLECPRT